MKKLELHWKILIGMFLGVVLGLIASAAGFKGFVIDWIKPFGTIFINLLKLIAIPLIIASLIKGVSDLKDISKLSKMGGRTVIIYLMTTVCAVLFGTTVGECDFTGIIHQRRYTARTAGRLLRRCQQ